MQISNGKPAAKRQGTRIGQFVLTLLVAVGLVLVSSTAAEAAGTRIGANHAAAAPRGYTEYSVNERAAECDESSPRGKWLGNVYVRGGDNKVDIKLALNAGALPVGSYEVSMALVTTSVNSDGGVDTSCGGDVSQLRVKKNCPVNDAFSFALDPDLAAGTYRFQLVITPSGSMFRYGLRVTRFVEVVIT